MVQERDKVHLTNFNIACFSYLDGPEAVVTIITDGYENSSKEWTGLAVKKLIEELKEDCPLNQHNQHHLVDKDLFRHTADVRGREQRPRPSLPASQRDVRPGFRPYVSRGIA